MTFRWHRKAIETTDLETRLKHLEGDFRERTGTHDPSLRTSAIRLALLASCSGDCFESFEELPGLNRLRQKIIHPDGPALLRVFCYSVSRQGHNRGMFAGLLFGLPNGRGYFPTVQLRHLNVQQN